MRRLMILVLIVFNLYASAQMKQQLIDVEAVNSILPDITVGNTISFPLSDHLCDITILQEDLSFSQKLLKGRKNYEILSGQRRGKLLVTDRGVILTIMGPEGLVTLAPNKTHNSYTLEEGKSISAFNCGVEVEEASRINNTTRSPDVINGDITRIYRLALVTTGEFYEENGGTSESVIDAIVYSINGLNSIYEQELSITFEVDDRVVIYTNKDTDPFIPDLNGGLRRTLQAGKAINDVFDSDQYDVGHVLHNHLTATDWSTGGIAKISAACDSDVNSQGVIGKGSGWSGNFLNNNNDWLELLSHEIAHMLGATHTFNGTGQSCTNNVNKNNAVEIGSGTTIMSYRGLCSSDQNVPVMAGSPLYFHIRSIEEIISFVDGIGTCYQSSPSGNEPPQIDFGPCEGEPFLLPVGTPFALKVNASDPDGDPVMYNWEQVDEDGIGASPTQGYIGEEAAQSTLAPIFRSRPPAAEPFRFIPELTGLYNEVDDPFEVLPQVNRDVEMKVNARDGVGGIASQSVKLHFQEGPLEITFPGQGNDLFAGEDFTMTWNTNGTSSMCDEVDIYLLDIAPSGNTETLLATGVSYDAEEYNLFIPPSIIVEGTVRLKLQCTDYSCYFFYQLSDEINYSRECEVSRHLICDDDEVVAEEGSAMLLLSNDIVPYEYISSIDMFIDENDDFRIFTRFDTEGMCEMVRFSSGGEVFTPQEFQEFQVEESGEYEITKMGGNFFNIFRVENYDENNPCASFVASNGVANPQSQNPTSTFISSSVNVYLEACTPYYMMGSVFTEPGPISLRASGPGKMISTSTSRYSGGYSYVVFDEAGFISSIMAIPDLREFDKGVYFLRSLETPEGEDVSTFLGNNINSLQSSRSCLSVGLNQLSVTISAGDRDGDGFNSDEDCDDRDATINPMAEEIPNNSVDENCDGEALVIDEDMDGFNSDEDCNDGDASINPAAEEIPNNSVDENCDGEALVIDEDMDGFNSDEDCNDEDASINPMAEEIPNNSVDENCDGEALVIDEDMDGFNSDEDCDDGDASINPMADEIPNNGIDENCDGMDASTSVLEINNVKLTVNPNPFSDLLILDNQSGEELWITILDMNGKIIRSLKIDRHHTKLDCSNMMPGVYILHARTMFHKMQIVKLVKY